MRIVRLLLLVPVLLLIGAAAHAQTATRPAVIDYAESKHADAWLRHPVLGDPSFDAFERLPGNPIHRGTPDFAWPVNGFLFVDPPSGHWYVYVGEYRENYGGGTSRCVLLRSRDRGRTWEDLGPVLTGDADRFDRNGHTPDVSVVFDGGRYHMIYDWGEPDFNAEGGIAYAWADKPEGPWHRAAEPITRKSTTEPIDGRYQRTYAATLIRRPHDWLILGMTDVPPNAWAMWAMTAPNPEGPYSRPALVRRPDSTYYHPPLMEFFPAFAHDGHLYAPATSVAANRNVNVLFRAPLERATVEDAWEIVRHGSLWHAEPVGHEHFGLWGQTFSGQVLGDGTLLAMFPSRDNAGRGTINLARRPWNRPFRDRGFVLSGHAAPSLTLLRAAHRDVSLDAELTIRGTVRIVLDHAAPLGPDAPTSNAAPHPLSMTRHSAVALTPTAWRVLNVDRGGTVRVLSEAEHAEGPTLRVRFARTPDDAAELTIGGQRVWTGPLPAPAEAGVGSLGLWVDRQSHAAVDRFVVTGDARVGTRSFLFTEALLGAGRGQEGCELRSEDPLFRHRVGGILRGPGVSVKWNVWGRRLTLWSPKGPAYGSVSLTLDGRDAGTVDLHAPEDTASAAVWTSELLADWPHALVVRCAGDAMPVDSLDVAGP